MALKKGAPGKGGDAPRREQFSYTNTQPGLKNTWSGWLACEPYWCEAHEHKPPRQIGTKPCLAWLTEGKLGCPWCRPGEAKKWIGYVHVYREEDRAPCLVLVHDSVADLMAGLTFATHVLIGRVEGQSSAFVKRSNAARHFTTELEHRKRAIDSAVSLLGIWNVPALSDWYMRRPAGLPPEEQERYTADEYRETLRGGGHPTLGQMADLLLPPAAADVVKHRNEQFVKEAKSPRKNGKHPPPAEG